MAAVASHQGLEDAVANSRKIIDDWAAKQKAAAERIALGVEEEFATFQKKMDEIRTKHLATQVEEKLVIDGKENSQEYLEKEIELQQSAHAKLEAILNEKKVVVSCEFICVEFPDQSNIVIIRSVDSRA